MSRDGCGDCHDRAGAVNMAVIHIPEKHAMPMNPPPRGKWGVWRAIALLACACALATIASGLSVVAGPCCGRIAGQVA